MNGAQITMLILITMGLLLGAHEHGKLQEAKPYSFWKGAILLVLQQAILYWGGFWDGIL